MVDCAKNLYEILEISPNASFEEIKLAYKKLVRIYHPDINNSNDAEIKFKLLNNAYEVLSDKERRRNYDLLLNFGGYKKGEIIKKEEKTQKKEKQKEEKIVYPGKEAIIKEIKITEKEALSGTSRTVNILNTQNCPKCMGKKFINGIKCAFCLGEGEKKELRKIEVKINKGIKNGEYIYVGKVNSSALYDKNLFLKVFVELPKKMYFEGEDIIVHVEIPLYDSILGTSREINIEPLGLINVEIPPLCKPETRIKLDCSNKKTNYYATIDVIFPDNISNEEKKLYDRIRSINMSQEK